MAFQHVVTKSLHAANRTHQFAKTYSADASGARAIPVPENSTDLEVSLAIDISHLTNLWLVSTVDMTIETNYAGPDPLPDDTIELKANVPLIWNADEALQKSEIPLTEDVTALFLTTGAVGAGMFICEVLQDSTPP